MRYDRLQSISYEDNTHIRKQKMQNIEKKNKIKLHQTFSFERQKYF